MLKKTTVLIAAVLLLSGCSPDKWIASYYIVQAESTMDRAGNLKAQKMPFEKRVAYYEKACAYFSKAYERNPAVYTLARIEAATDCCWKANNEIQEEIFKEFEEDYIKNHPQEYEHGDSGVAMMEMG